LKRWFGVLDMHRDDDGLLSWNCTDLYRKCTKIIGLRNTYIIRKSELYTEFLVDKIWLEIRHSFCVFKLWSFGPALVNEVTHPCLTFNVHFPHPRILWPDYESPEFEIHKLTLAI
jgi:hypothetical protein